MVAGIGPGKGYVDVSTVDAETAAQVGGVGLEVGVDGKHLHFVRGRQLSTVNKQALTCT